MDVNTIEFEKILHTCGYELTAQRQAILDIIRDIDSDVDTIFEIGGQDSKFISIENGGVVDFQMNKICAAGTGSFIEE